LRDVMGRRAELNVSPPYPSLRDPYVSSTASTVFDFNAARERVF